MKMWDKQRLAPAGWALVGVGVMLAGCHSQERARNTGSMSTKAFREPREGQVATAAEAAKMQLAQPDVPIQQGPSDRAAAPIAPSGVTRADQAQFKNNSFSGRLATEMQKMAALPGSAPPPAYNPNMYVSNTYLGGNGEKDRLEKLIQAGVLVDGKRVKLESFARSYAQTFPIPTKTALNLVVDTERGSIVTSGDHTYLQVGLQALKGEMPRRPPLNIALVIDRSGSMANEHKLEYVKTAAAQLVEQLHPEDTFSLVAFDDSVNVLVHSRHIDNKNVILQQITHLQPGGGTNIYAGLQAGYAELHKNASAAGVNRVILLSDGEVTAGVADPEAFHRLTSGEVDNDIQTSAIGVGVEFNEDLMLSLARDGKGNYHFLKDGADTRQVLAKEMDELTHTVAKAIKLRIRLADGVGLVRVLGAQQLDANQARQARVEERKIDRRVADELGISANRQHTKDEQGIKMLIPNFYRGDSHIVMLEVTVPPGTGQRKLADVFLQYKDLVTLSNRETQSSVAIQYTPNRAEMIAGIHRNVKKNLLGFQTGEALTEAASLIAHGQVAEAVRRVDERMAVLGVAAREWNDHDLDQDGKLLDRYKAVLAQLGKTPQLAQSDFGQYLARSLTYNGYNMTR